MGTTNLASPPRRETFSQDPAGDRSKIPAPAVAPDGEQSVSPIAGTLTGRMFPIIRWRQSYLAPVTLLAAGLLLALTTNLAKVSQGLGMTPLSYLTWSLTGAALILTMFSHYRGKFPVLNRRSIEYYVLSGFLTVAGTNLIFFSAVRHLGVSFVAMMISLPPLLTYLGALMLRMERFCWRRATGVALALAGTAYLVLQQWEMPGSDPAWIALALLGPVLLSAGNIYRSRRWPPGASAESLAPGMLLGAIVALVMLSSLFDLALEIPLHRNNAVLLVFLQSVVFAGQFLMLFVLQKAGGPVTLSLMGGVSAVFAVPIAMILLSEPALPGLAVSASLIALGILCMLLGVTTCNGETAASIRQTTAPIHSSACQ